MEEEFIDNIAAKAKSVEELLGRYQQWPENGRSVARDVARRYLIIRDERDVLKARLETACRVEAGDKVEFDHAILEQARADVIELREALRSLYGAYDEARSDGDRYFGARDGEETIGRLLADPPEQDELKAKGGEA